LARTDPALDRALVIDFGGVGQHLIGANIAARDRLRKLGIRKTS